MQEEVEPPDVPEVLVPDELPDAVLVPVSGFVPSVNPAMLPLKAVASSLKVPRRGTPTVAVLAIKTTDTRHTRIAYSIDVTPRSSQQIGARFFNRNIKTNRKLSPAFYSNLSNSHIFLKFLKKA